MFGKVWSTFQVTKEDGSLLKLRIQDLPESKITEAADMFNKLAYEETFHIAAGVCKNPKAVEQARCQVTEFMKEPEGHFTICCVDEDDGGIGPILGVSAMALVSLDSLEPPYKGTGLEPEMVTLINIMNVSVISKTMKEQQLSRFYDGRGLYINPGFRKLGIATEFLKLRCQVCIEQNVAATAAFMTSTATEKAAEKSGWKTVLELDLDDLGQQHGVTFEEGGVVKLMIWKNPQFKIEDV